MMGSNEVWDEWQKNKKNLPFHSFALPPSLLYSVTHTHTHTNSYTSRNRGSNSLTKYRSPHVDNVTFSAFHYLVLTIRELPLTPPQRLSAWLCIYFGISGMFWEQLSFCVIATATVLVTTLQLLHHIWGVKRLHDLLTSGLYIALRENAVTRQESFGGFAVFLRVKKWPRTQEEQHQKCLRGEKV